MPTENIILWQQENTILPIHTENNTLLHTKNIILLLHTYSVYTFSVCTGKMIISVCILNRNLSVTYREFKQRIALYYIKRISFYLYTKKIPFCDIQRILVYPYIQRMPTENIILWQQENTILPIHAENNTLLHTQNIIGVAIISRLLENSGFFCRIQSLS